MRQVFKPGCTQLHSRAVVNNTVRVPQAEIARTGDYCFYVCVVFLSALTNSDMLIGFAQPSFFFMVRLLSGQ